ncbi:glutathione peroxidase homolog with thioredoxin peroxidase activity isoform 2-T2 [Glossina fuscipes fuscipes]
MFFLKIMQDMLKINSRMRIAHGNLSLLRHRSLCNDFKTMDRLMRRRRLCLIWLPLVSVNCAVTKGRNLSSNGKEENISTTMSEQANSIYDFTVKDTYGNDVSLEQYRGHVVLIVNIASQCGLTKNNYKKLTDLREKYGEKGLKILNFPCNQFGSQMPEDDGEPMVCHLRDAKADIGDVFQKIDVNGANAAPLYQYLKAKQGGTLVSAIKWNFTKFLVNKEGIPIKRYAPTTDPLDIAKDIEKLL